MSSAKESFGDRFYRGLLRILPFDFRSEFGDDMEETFREQRAATVQRQGSMGVFRMWWATIVDIVRMAPREHLSVLSHDTRFALRMMLKNRAYTLAAVLILGLGIGANTSIFSVVNSVLLRPLPYAQGNQLVILRQHGARGGITDMPFSVSDINDYRQRNRSLSAVVEYHAMTFTLLGGTEPHRVRTGVVSNGFFQFLGVQPILGRAFAPDDEQAGAVPVLILSYEFWKNQERGDPNIIGRKYQMNDRAHLVIGVLPPIPQYPNENDVYMTTTSCPFRMRPTFIANRNGRMMRVFGRLKPDVTIDQAKADLGSIAGQLEKEYPASYAKNIGYGITPLALRNELTQEARPLLWTLLGAAAFVLLIACANVANLILARMARRERELTIRTAMGAGAGRLLRQLLTESLILALLAAAVGIAFAYGSMGLLTRFAGQLTPRAREISLDGWVLGLRGALRHPDYGVMRLAGRDVHPRQRRRSPEGQRRAIRPARQPQFRPQRFDRRPGGLLLRTADRRRIDGQQPDPTAACGPRVRTAARLCRRHRPQLHQVSRPTVAAHGRQAPAGTDSAVARRTVRRRIVELPDGRRQRRRGPPPALPRFRRQSSGYRDAARCNRSAA